MKIFSHLPPAGATMSCLNSYFIKAILFCALLFSTIVASSQTTVLGPGPDAESATMSSLETNVGAQFMTFDFSLLCNNTGSPGDFLFTGLDIDIVDTSIDWSQVIAGASLRQVSSDGGSGDDGPATHAGGVTITATQIQFTTIDDGNDEIGEVDDTNGAGASDGEEKQYEVDVYFSTSIPASIASQLEGKVLELMIDETSFTSSQNGFTGLQSTSSGGTNNTIEVTGTEYRFLQGPTNAQVNSTMLPTVTLEITDVNGNRDLAAGHIPTISLLSTGAGNPSFGPIVWSNGVGTSPAIVHTTAETGLELSSTGASGLSHTGLSTMFDIEADVAPTVTSITRDDSNPTNAASVDYTVTFSENVNDVEVTDFVVTGVGASGSVSAVSSATGQVFTVTVNTITGDGTLRLDFSTTSDDNAVDDTANPVSADFTSGEVYTIDNTLDLSSVARQTPGTSPTNADALIWRFTFTDVVSNLDGTDFTINNTTATVTNIADQTGGVYDVTISGGDLAGLNATPDIAVNISDIVDAVGNTLSSGTPTGLNVNSYVVDNASPDLTSVARQAPATSPTNADALIWRFTFTDPVSNLDGTDFTINNTTATVTNIADQTGGVYDITISGGDLAGLNATPDIAVTVSDITDLAGNALSSGTPTGLNVNSYVVDNILDLTSVARQAPGTSPTNADALIWRFIFTDVVSNLDGTDFTINNTTATVTNIADQTGGVYDVTISGGDLAALNATPDIAVSISDIVDAAGNALSSGTPTGSNVNTYVVDNASPDLTSVARQTPGTSPTNADALIWRFIFTQEVSNLDGTDFTINNTTATVTNIADQTGGVYDITISGGDLAGSNATPDIAVNVSDITDLAGNALSSGTPTGSNVNTYIMDNVAPTVTNLEIFDVDNDGLVERIDITFDSNIDTDDGNPPVIADLGTLLLPDGSQVLTSAGLGISDPAGGTNMVSITNIAVVDHLVGANTAVGSTGIDNLTGLWADVAGNTILAGGDDAETVTDSAVPVLASSTPPDNSSSASTTADIVLTFSEDIQVGTGNITLNDVTGVSTVQVFDVTTDVTFGTNTITINPTSDLTLLNEYAIQVDATAVDEQGNAANSYAGINNDDDLDFIPNNIQPNDCGHDYTTTPTGESSNGNLSPSFCNFEPASVSSLADTEGEAVSVFYFNVVNGSDGHENMTSITIENGNTDIDWRDVIAGAQLINEDGAIPRNNSDDEIMPTIGANSLAWTGIDADNGGGDWGDLAGNDDKANGYEFALRVWFKTDLEGEAVDIDGKNLVFTLNTGNFSGVDRVFTGTNYQNQSGTNISSGNITFNVVATHYNFGVSGSVPTDTDQNSVMNTVQLQATDINGSRDLGYTTTDAVTITSSGAANPAPTASVWTAGLATVSDIIHIAGGVGLTLGTSGGALVNTFLSNNAALPNSGALAATFTINPDNTPPVVTSITPNISTTISDSDVGSNTFTVTVLYNESLDGITNPTIAFSPDVAGSGDIVFQSGAFASNVNVNDTYIATYDVVDNNLNQGDIDISSNGAVDAAGPNTQTAAGTEVDEFSIDTENPTIAITTPVSGDDRVNAAEDNTLVVSGTTTLTENGRIVTVTFTDGSFNTVVVTGPVTSNSWVASAADISGLDEGTITVDADVSDLAGNAATTATANIELDQTPPTVAINTPIEVDDIVNSVEDNTVSVSGSATGANGEIVTVTFTDGSFATVVTTGLVAAGIWTAADADISGLDEGTISVDADVDDLADNPATTASVNITLDNTASIAINTPITTDDIINASEDGALVISGTTASVEDAQIVTVTFTDQSFNTVVVNGPVTGGTWLASAADISGLDEGAITVTADVTDAVGNVAVQASESITLDQTAPTVLIDTPISIDDRVNAAEDGNVVVSGTTTLTEDNQMVTVTFDDTFTQIVVMGTVTGNIWTAAGADITTLVEGSITVTADVTDLAGNPAVQASEAITLDQTPPTVVIDTPISGDDLVNAAEDGALVVSGTTTLTEDNQMVTVTFDDTFTQIVVMGTVTANIWSAAAADISGLNEGLITVTADVDDLAGNPATQDSHPITLDQTATIAIDVPITADNIVNGVEDDALVITGTTVGVEDNQMVTVTFDNTIDAPIVRMATVTSNIWSSAAADLGGFVDGTVNLTADVSDLAGNAAVQAATTFTSDKFPPTVTTGNIIITTSGTGSGVPSAFLVGDVVTAQWDNTATGDNNGDVNTVTIDFDEFGGPTGVTAVNTANVWEASYTVLPGTDDGTLRNVTINATDLGGNLTSQAGVDDESVDNQLPVVTGGNITIGGIANGDGGEYIPGDQVTISWNNGGGGDNNPDIASVDIDFSAFGGAVESASQSLNTWSFVYTIVAGSVDASGLSGTVTANDDAGNPSATVASPTIAVDNELPVVTPVNIAISGSGGVSGEYIIGDVVTATWNNTGGGNNNTDITGGASDVSMDFSEFGGGIVAASNSSQTWTATYTILSGGIDAENDKNVFVTVTDDASNQTTQEDDASVVVDNQRPSAAVQPDLIAGDDLGTSSIDNITSEAQPSFVGAAGTAVASRPVFLYSDQPAPNTRLDAGVVTAFADGSWTVDIAATLASDLTNDVVHNIEFTTFDPAGNESLRSPALVYEHVSPPTIVSSQWLDSDADGDVDELEILFDKAVDIVDDDAENPFPSLTFSGSAAFLNTDFDQTNQVTVNLAIDPATTPGTANPGDIVTYSTAFNSVIRSTNGGIEVLNAENDTPTDGANPVIVNSISLDTDLDGDTDEIEIELSEVVNDGPFNASDFDVTSPNGTESLDNFFTDVDDLTVDAGSNDEFVRFTFGGGAATGTGVFDITYNAATIVDGNANPLLATNVVLVDGAAPRVELATGLTPADDSPSITVVNQLSVQFSEAVSGVAGRNVTVVQVIPPATDVLDANLNSDVDDTNPSGLVDLDVTGFLVSGTDYYVFMDPGTFVDGNNNVNEDQFNSSTNWNFTTNSLTSVSSTTPVSAVSIELNLNASPVAINVDAASVDFTVTDGLGTTFTVDALTAPGTNRLELSFDDNGITPDLTNAAGDLTINFDGVVGGGGTTEVDAGTFGDLIDFSGLVVDFDVTSPTIASATVTNDNLITLTYAGAEPVQLTGVTGADFVVQDGFGNIYPVTSVTDGVANDEFILLNFTGGGLMSAPVSPIGDIQIDYTNAGGISDFGGNTSITQSVSIDTDGTIPTLDGITTTGTTQINLDISEVVGIQSASPATDFTLLDGALNSFAVTVLSDAATGDDILELTVVDWSTAIGDLTLSYTASGTQISDFGGQNLGNFSGIPIEFDNTQPSIVSAVLISNTQIDVTFDEPIQMSASTSLSVTDESGAVFTIGGFTDTTPFDDTIELTFGDLSTALGDIIVSYNPGANEVTDFGTPVNVGLMSSAIIDLTFSATPFITENATPLAEDNAITDLAMYRAPTSGAAASAIVPFSITPSIDNGTTTIKVYRQNNDLSDEVVGAQRAAGSFGPYSPDLATLMGDDITDWTTQDANGVFTFYITETAEGGTPSESPAVEYSIALLDDLANTAAETNFSQSDEVGTSIGFNGFAGMDYLFAGDGLDDITYGGTPSARFVPIAAGDGGHQITINIENQVSNVDATFLPSEYFFTVTTTSNVFADGQGFGFGQTDGATAIAFNANPGNLDIGEGLPADPANPDFHDIEVYYIQDGSILTTIGNAGGFFNPFGGNIGGGETFGSVLVYDGDASIAAPINRFDGANPTYVVDEWTFDPSVFNALVIAGKNEIDTLLFVSLAKADNGSGALTQINFERVFLFPDPTVTIVDNGIVAFCEDDDSFTFEAQIQTYTNTAESLGGLDTTGLIQNGYVLEYAATSAFAPILNTVDYTGVTNFFDPQDPDGDANVVEDETGWYRITYTSLPQTDGNTIGSDTWEFELVQVATAPALDVASTGLNNNGGFSDNGTPGDVTDDFYVFEFCSGDVVPNIPIDVVTTQADPVPGVTNTEYNWYNSDGSVIEQGVATLLADDEQLFTGGTNTPTGNITKEFYVTRNLLGCESDSIPITIRIIDIPDEPSISLVDNVANSKAQNIFEDNGDYYFEYCAAQGATITYDMLNISSDLEDVLNRDFIERRSYFALYNTEFALYGDTIGIVSYGAGPGFAVDLAAKIGASTTAAGTANGIVTQDFWISKIVADSTIFDGGTFTGCESSDRTKVTVAIYTNPDIPALDSYTGSHQDVGGIVNYYMCEDETFPFVGFQPPTSAVNTEFEWYTDAALTDRINTANSTGQVLSVNDLISHTDPGGNFSSSTANTYTYYTRLVSNLNGDSQFTGCEGPSRQVNITVFPLVTKPIVTVDPAALNTPVASEANFEHVFSFCVDAATGLSQSTLFEVNNLTPPASGLTEALQWFEADQNGTIIIGSQIDEADNANGNDVSAFDLKIQGTLNDEFYFAVLYNTEQIDAFPAWPGCVNSFDTTFVKVVVSTFPDTQYSFSGITAGEMTTFDFFDPNGSSILPNGVDFVVTAVGGSTPEFTHQASDLTSFQHSFSAPGTYEGTLSIETQAGCISTVTRRFQILEKITIVGSYSQDFDGSDAGGWFEEFQLDGGILGSLAAGDTTRISSWQHGVPAGTNINGTYNGVGSAWSTTGTTAFDVDVDDPNNAILTNSGSYVGGEQSFVYSPAFDISGLLNPAILMRTFRDFDGIKDGVVFQFSDDDGVTWNTLGDYDINLEFPSSGQDWYNNSAISSAPGNGGINGGTGFNPNRVGWADQDVPAEGWVESTHALTIPDRSNIRFRFALGASGAFSDTKSGNGFGFDGMEIFDLGRTVLIEQFSSSLSSNSKSINDTFLDPNPQIGIDDDQVMWLNYFTDFANDETRVDPVNARNTVAPGARATYYGVDNVPKSVVDGDLFVQKSPSTRSWATNDVNIAALAPAFFEFPAISNTSTDPGVLSIDVSFTSQSTKSNADFSFVLAIVERRVAAADFGGIGVYTASTDTLRNVVRILLPGPAGWNYVGNVDSDPTGNPDESVFSYSVDWTIDNVYDASQLRIIAFAQDNDTREILQSGYLDVPTSTESILGLTDLNKLSVYPNPSDEWINVEFGSPVAVDSEWILYDQSGKKVLGDRIEKGVGLLKIDSKELPSGMYFINIFSDENHMKVARVIISH
ncbi:MAG: Ig-like domain-containing protein [Cyclobacteriaceae bacterium]